MANKPHRIPASPTSISFELATAGRILFGAGRRREIGALAAELGRRALLVRGSSGGAIHRAEPMVADLRAHGISCEAFAVEGEPTLDTVRRGAQRARETASDLVIALGGGSALDAGKAIAALMTHGGDPLDYVEVIGRGQSLTKPAAPCVAVPTTAGTGAEVTRNSVLGSPEHRVKVSLRSPRMLPRAAVVDPELTRDLPPELTAATGMDALTQLIEPFVSVRANPFTDGVCREGLGRAGRSLRRAFEDGGHAGAREDMALASLFGGIALANAGLGAVHGFAAPIGGMFPAPHGAVCASLLPQVMEANLRALRQREPGGDALARYDEVARILTGRDDANADDAVSWVRELAAAMRIPTLAVFGITAADLPILVEKAAAASSMKGNPVALTGDELQAILVRSL